jgi:CheY-like chemotaxis protein
MPNSQAAVLIVEDNAQLRMLLSVVLTQLGCTVRSAEDGFTALAEIRAEIPDVILSDLYMPGMSGFEFLSVVRRRFPAVRAVAMSSAFSGASVPPGIVADAYYEKATNVTTLLQIMNELTYAQRPPAFQDSTTKAPLWITKAGHTLPEDDSVVIACPECLRTFPQTPGESTPIHETGCVHCNNHIHYAIVDTLDPTSPKSSVN